MEGYMADDAYQNKEAFFKKYFFGYQFSRLEYYYRFLTKHLSKNERILSLASGRAAVELYLMEDGYEIVCSDLEILPAYNATRTLFPEIQYLKYDVLSAKTPQKYDAIICLSLTYLFDDQQLHQFFGNVAESLVAKGRLLLDPAGPPDNIWSYIMHDLVLKYETWLKRIIRWFERGKWYGFIVKDFGYRRTDKEIIRVAEQYGLRLTDQENYADLTEFSRSYFFQKIIDYCPGSQKLLGMIGKRMPYIRMFNFQKI
jgi:hypothetical protein